jgi:hypothetical protein
MLNQQSTIERLGLGAADGGASATAAVGLGLGVNIKRGNNKSKDRKASPMPKPKTMLRKIQDGWRAPLPPPDALLAPPLREGGAIPRLTRRD